MHKISFFLQIIVLIKESRGDDPGNTDQTGKNYHTKHQYAVFHGKMTKKAQIFPYLPYGTRCAACGA
jgi:hypothetical protein